MRLLQSGISLMEIGVQVWSYEMSMEKAEQVSLLPGMPLDSDWVLMAFVLLPW